MSLEQKIEALTAALNANTEALKFVSGSTPAPAASEKAPAAKSKSTKAEKPAGPVHSVEATCALLTKIKDEFGLQHAKDVLKECGLEKMAGVDDKNTDKVFDKAEAKYEELSSGSDAEEDGI